MKNQARTASLPEILGLIGGLLLLSGRISAAQTPNATAYVWKNVVIGGGGYVTDVVTHPGEKDLVYIRTDVGGFFRWNASGRQWISLSDGFRREESNYYGGEGLAIDPRRPNVVFVAAGKYGWSELPGRLFRSTDRGRTWRPLSLAVRMGGNEDHRWGGPRLVLTAAGPPVLFFGSRHDGLFRSRDDGKTWTRLNGLPARGKEGIGINALACVPTAGGTIFASVFGDGIFASDDLGERWRRLENGPADAERLAAGADGHLYATHGKGVARWDGQRWTEITPPGESGGFGGLSVHPRDPKDLLVTGQSGELRLFRSRDRGATWKRVVTETRSSVPWYSGGMRQIQYVAGLAFDAAVPNRVWLTDWYATYRTEDIDAPTVTFASDERGHEEVVVFSLAAPPVGLPLLSGVADVDGFPHESLTEFPTKGFGDYYGGTGPTFGDCLQIAWCATRPLSMARVGGRRWNGTGGGATSDDGGRTWRGFGQWDEKTVPARIAISATDPANLVVLKLGADGGLSTRDGGKSWQPVEGLDGVRVHDTWNWTQPLAADGAKPATFYAYHEGTLFRSEDGGTRFVPAATGLPKGGNPALVTVPGQAGRVYLSVGEGGLHRSTDGGTTFAPVVSVAGSHLFAVGKAAPGATEPTLYLYGRPAKGRDGIYRSTDGGVSWQTIQDPAIPVGDDPNSMAASWQTFGRVFIGTNGRGIYFGEPKPPK
ncbi:MAG: hypothetical protein SFU56_00035 [Capsulimonadales bacterium]|nr:hypothetical protein [Capsulimonadales bacterium]